MPPLANSRGDPTGAVYGLINMLRRLLSDYDTGHVAVIFDARGRTFRDDLYEDYKANRTPMPEELERQIEPAYAVIRALGLPLLEIRGVEADDVIGTLARRANEAGRPVLIATGDKDMAQLVDEHTTLVNTMDDTVLDPQGVQAKFGVAPERIVDYLALVGDSTDNVPGVPRVGPKTAVKWLNEYGSLQGVMEHAAEIGGKVGESLREALPRLPLWRELVTIRRDVPLDVALSGLARGELDYQALREQYAELEFKNLLAEVLEHLQAQAAAQVRYETVLERARFEEWVARLEAAELFAIDLETTSLDYMSGEVVGISFAVEPGEAAYVPVAHIYPGALAQLPRGLVLERMRPLLEDPARDKLGHNLKYDTSILANHGIEMRGVRFDTMLESYVLDSTATRHDMDSLSLKYLSHRTIRYEDVAGKGARQLSFDQVRLEEAGPYAAEDADVTLKLHRALWPRLTEQSGLRRVFEQIEMPLVPVLSHMERNGVRVDVELLARQSEELSARIHELEGQVFEQAGTAFNLGSPKQIQELLFERLKLPVRSRTPKGQPSTAESVLQDLALDFPLPRLILEHRALSKLKSTYLDALPLRVNPATGRVHTSYHQAVTSTGRLSSAEPNLQNIPVRTAEGRRIRQAFVASPGYKLLAADYSQIELRIMAHLSGDAGLRRAFAEDRDIHQATAAEVFGSSLQGVTSDQRRRAKAINFGLIYGMSAFGLARQLGIERDEAELYMNRYFDRYPGVRAYMDESRARAHRTGYVETVFGRRLYLPEINSRNVQRRGYAERTAINAPMQGSAADIIKRAMVQVDEWIGRSGLDVKMIMQVHDELVFEVAEGALEQAREAIRGRMSTAAELAVPLVVELGVGDNWDQAH
jgi:DNA polymerase-1